MTTYGTIRFRKPLHPIVVVISRQVVNMWSMGVHVKIRSKSFRSGFAEGFSSPMTFFKGQSYHRVKTVNATIDSAWKDVESVLRDSCVEWRRRGEGTGKEVERKR